jgi:hypothetical protein
MQKIVGGGTQPRPVGQNETYRTVVSDLTSVTEQVRKSLKWIESEIASGSLAEQGGSDHIVVLDDVTPSYTRVYAALRECDARLSVALYLLQESLTPGEHACEYPPEGLPPAPLPISA